MGKLFRVTELLGALALAVGGCASPHVYEAPAPAPSALVVTPPQVLQLAQGQLSAVGDGTVSIYTPQTSKSFQLQVGPATQVTLDGHPATLRDLPQGADVRAAFAPSQGVPVAARLDVTSRPGAPPSGAR